MRTLKSNCHYCGYLCGFLAGVEDVAKSDRYPDGEKLSWLKPDPSRYPYSEAITNGCRRWQMNLEEIDSPDRINYPLKRVAGSPRGGGKWERISWEQALDEIAAKITELARLHGNQTLATAIGGPHAAYWPLHRFMNLWGSPNNMGIGQICWNIRIWMDALAYGWPIEVNVDPAVTEQLFLWGTNPAQSDNSLFWRTILRMVKAGTPLVVIDPRRTQTAAIATLHLAPRPGSDCTLALAIIREIIARERYDYEFVSRWCHGFDQLRQHVEPYTLEYAEKITAVAAGDIARAAEIFSRSGPTALLSGRGIDQLGPNTAPTHRAISALRAITGDVDRPGACHIMEMSDFTPEVDLEMSDWLSDEARSAQLNQGVSPLQSYFGYAGARELTSRLGQSQANPGGNRLPMRYLTSAHPNLVWRAALLGENSMSTGKGAGLDATGLGATRKLGDSAPYRVSALICMGANPLITYADTQLVYRALQAMELLVVLEYHMTPTAQLADYVLPSAGAFEQPQFQAHGGVSNFAYGGAAAVQPYYERRCDYQFWRELGIRLGQAEYWPEQNFAQAIEATLAVAGYSWQQWQEHGIYYNTQRFYKHDLLGADGKPQGFATTTGKLELASEYLVKLGSTPLPKPVPLPEFPHVAGAVSFSESASQDVQVDARSSDLELGRPVILITGARKQPYWASSYLNNSEFRSRYPLPLADMSKATLASLGISAGDWVTVRTAKGEAQFVAAEAEQLDGIVSVDYGWWFPEEKTGLPHLSGAFRSNANMLTSCDIENCEPLIGSWTYNGIVCYVRAS
jgi:anaerobic selenocysteine-containing dehydrogenase